MTFAITMSNHFYAEPSLSVAFKHSNQRLSGNVTHRHSSYRSSIVLSFTRLLTFGNQQVGNLCVCVITLAMTLFVMPQPGPFYKWAKLDY